MANGHQEDAQYFRKACLTYSVFLLRSKVYLGIINTQWKSLLFRLFLLLSRAWSSIFVYRETPPSCSPFWENLPGSQCITNYYLTDVTSVCEHCQHVIPECSEPSSALCPNCIKTERSRGLLPPQNSALVTQATAFLHLIVFSQNGLRQICMRH